MTIPERDSLFAQAPTLFAHARDLGLITIKPPEPKLPLVALRSLPKIPLEKIITIVARFYKIDRALLISRERVSEYLSDIRSVGYKLARECGYTYSAIARAFGRSEHATCMGCIKKINGAIDTRPQLAAEIEKLRAKIRHADRSSSHPCPSVSIRG